jgi:hypothetical protein
MRVSKFTPAALLAALSILPIEAVASPAYDCSLAEVYECAPMAGCQRLPGGSPDLPPTVTLNVKQKNLFSGLFGGQGLLQSGDVYEDPRILILHGRRDLQTWTAVVAKDTGAYYGTVSQLGKTFSQFGTCIGKDVP